MFTVTRANEELDEWARYVALALVLGAAAERMLCSVWRDVLGQSTRLLSARSLANASF